MAFCCKLAVMARAVAASRLSPTLLTMCIIISDLESRMAGDADIATAAPAALYDVPLLGGKPGGEHIVDLAGDAPQVAGQLVALDFRRAVFLV